MYTQTSVFSLFRHWSVAAGIGLMSLQAAAATRPGLGLAFGIHVAASRVCGCGNPGDLMVATVAATHIRIDERGVAEARLSWERRVVALFCSKMNTSPAMLHDTIRYDTMRYCSSRALNSQFNKRYVFLAAFRVYSIIIIV